eukprot:GEMP01061553.1.p1 GENE.GEMP01061553.1~~GEMP01061553.1.p1  ORF type:complete len:171 (+),score=24.85 GEMP01061553.1:387-899(+)
MMCLNWLSINGMREFLGLRELTKGTTKATLIRNERNLALAGLVAQLWLYGSKAVYSTFIVMFFCTQGYVIYLVIRVVIALDAPVMNRMCAINACTWFGAAAIWLVGEIFCEQFGFLHPHVFWHIGASTGVSLHLLFHFYIVNPQKARTLKLKWRYGVPMLAAAGNEKWQD